jgi:hypothetical protein
LKVVLQYFFQIFRDDKNYRSKRSKKFDANAPANRSGAGFLGQQLCDIGA